LEVDLLRKLRADVGRLAANAWQQDNLPVPQVGGGDFFWCT
jgi:hypothetical protein